MIESVYESYAQKRGVSTDASSVDSTTTDDKEDDFDAHMFGEQNKEGQTELEIFLREPTLPVSTDPIAWWRSAAPRFPTLASIARDYLSVPGKSFTVVHIR